MLEAKSGQLRGTPPGIEICQKILHQSESIKIVSLVRMEHLIKRWPFRDARAGIQYRLSRRSLPNWRD